MKLKLFLLILFTTIILNAEFSINQIQQAKVAVAKNPSLLNTPQAQKALKQYQEGNLKNDTLINNQKQDEKFTNDIVDYDSQFSDGYILEKKITPKEKYTQSLEKQIEERGTLRQNPQSYLTNNEELIRIKSIRKFKSYKKLERFSKVFFRNKNKIANKNINAPSTYIINRGDTITFWVYGATNQKHTLEVNNQGNINIPEIGPVRVAGERYNEVKELLTNYLSSSYKNSEVIVDLDSFSTAQITLTGFVNAPGIYNTTSVSSVKDILIEAKGVSDVGSIRNIQVKRNNEIIATIDYYHLLNLGLDYGDIVLQPNDTIHIPRAYGLVKIEGAVNKEAIFEIKKGEKLKDILKIAGGTKSVADRFKIYIKRYDHNRQIKYNKITLKEANRFILKDGDEIYIGEMGIENEKYIDIIGNIISEGKRKINSNSIQLSTLLKREIRNNYLNTFFLENTQLNYAVIKRIGEDLTPQMFNINLENVLDGVEDFTLFNRDTLVIFNKLDTAINPYVTIKQAKTEIEALQKEAEEEVLLEKQVQEQEGDTTQFSKLNEQIDSTKLSKLNEQIDSTKLLKNQNKKKDESLKEKEAKEKDILMNEGKFLFTKGMTLKDIINLAGVKSPFDRQRVKIVSFDPQSKETFVSIVNYDQRPKYKLKAFDTVYLFDLFETTPVPKAYISGEVIQPGSYEVSPNMTLLDFINSAGGLSDKAYPKECEIIRYTIENGERKKQILNIKMDKVAMQQVFAYDEINIKKIPFWSDRKTVLLSGEVKFPGSYTIRDGEKLSSLIKRAGGYTNEAFLYGAVFTRVKIAKMQKESIKMTLSKLKEQIILTSLQSATSKSMNSISISEGIMAIESLIKEAEELTPPGRITINLKDNIDSFKDCNSDLTLQDGDKLHIPPVNDTVIVSGEVMNPSAMTYNGKSINDYISKSGGLTEIANSDYIYVLHANGEAEKATLGSYLFSSGKVKVKKGDVIIVPKKLMLQRGIDIVSEVADIFYKLTLTVAAMNTVGAI